MIEQSMKTALLEAALPHVVFDGWSERTFQAACAAVNVPEDQAQGFFPRGALDLALFFHATGDDAMQTAFAQADIENLRYRDKVALAVRLRLEAIDDKEAVRRAAALLALPHHAGDSTKALWGTADAIWSALGDTSEDLNWYSKRATLSGVYAATVLFWLGDDSVDHADTWAFLDRRIEDVMRIEKLKAQVNKMPGIGKFARSVQSMVKKPSLRTDVPGSTRS